MYIEGEYDIAGPYCGSSPKAAMNLSILASLLALPAHSGNKLAAMHNIS